MTGVQTCALPIYKIFDGIIIKPDQVGSITEMFEAVNKAKQLNQEIIISHRSGESNDDFIADLAYGLGADGIKIGAPARGERISKYNRLLEIEYSLESLQPQSNAPTYMPIQPVEKAPQPEPVKEQPMPLPEPSLSLTGLRPSTDTAKTSMPSPGPDTEIGRAHV